MGRGWHAAQKLESHFAFKCCVCKTMCRHVRVCSLVRARWGTAAATAGVSEEDWSLRPQCACVFSERVWLIKGGWGAVWAGPIDSPSSPTTCPVLSVV